MKILKYVKFLEEVELNLTILKDIRKGKTRGDNLISRLKDKTPTLTKNTTGNSINIISIKDMNNEWVSPENIVNFISTDGIYDEEKAKEYFLSKSRYRTVFKDVDGNEYRLNQIKKDITFGASGSGVNTKLYEIIQCIFIAYCLVYPYSSLKGYKNKEGQYIRYFNGEKDTSFIDTVIGFLNQYKNNEKIICDRLNLNLDLSQIDKGVIDKISDNPDWFSTFTSIPPALFALKNNGTDIFSNSKGYTLFHISDKSNSPIKSLKEKYSKISRDEGWKIEFSKYCPADLFITETIEKDNIISGIEGCVNMLELTSLLDSYFDQGNLIPVSLKKIGRSVNDIDSFKLIINKEKGKKLPKFKLDHFIITNKPDKGISSKIEVGSEWTSESPQPGEKPTEITRDVSIDSSNTNKKQNVDLEVEGDYSRHGKASFIFIKRLIDKTKEKYSNVRIQELYDYKELNKEYYTDNKLDSMIEETYVKINRLASNTIKVKPLMTRGRELDSKSKKISKLQSLQIVLALEQIFIISPEVGNSILTDIMRYALSIKTDKFDTPRYIRVI